MPLSPGPQSSDREFNYHPMAALWSALAPLGLTDDFGALSAMATLELRETEDSLLVTATLPGMDLRDVQIQASPHSLTLWGEQQAQYPTLHGYRLSREQFRHNIPLPVAVQDTQIQVAFQADTLVITLPKARRWSLLRSSFQSVPTLEPWTLMDEMKYQGQRVGLGWRHLKQWFGRQLRRWGDWLLSN